MADRVHDREIPGYEGRTSELATGLARLTYDEVANILGVMAAEFARQSKGDFDRGRPQLAALLKEAAESTSKAQDHIKNAWDICLPHVTPEELQSVSLKERLRKAGIVYREPVKLRGGEVSNFYVDIKKAYGDPELLAAMAGATVKNIDPRTTCIAASGYGGIPLGAAVSQLSRLPLALVRDEEKRHGRGGLIDGYMPGRDDKISLVDDVFTSGNSMNQTVANLAGTGAEIIGCHVIVARGDVSEFTMPVSYLLTSDDIMRSDQEVQ